MPDAAASEIFHLSQLINQLWGAPGGTPIRREVRASIVGEQGGVVGGEELGALQGFFRLADLAAGPGGGPPGSHPWGGGPGGQGGPVIPGGPPPGGGGPGGERCFPLSV